MVISIQSLSYASNVRRSGPQLRLLLKPATDGIGGQMTTFPDGTHGQPGFSTLVCANQRHGSAVFCSVRRNGERIRPNRLVADEHKALRRRDACAVAC